MKLLSYAASTVIVLVIFMLLISKAGAQDVTVTVDGVAVDVKGVTIAITTTTEPPVEPPIPPVEPPIPPVDPSVCGTTPPNGQVVSWFSVFGETFPMPKSRQKVVSIPKTGGWLGVRFETRATHDTGAVANFEASGTLGLREMVMSRCPGSFAVADSCKVVIGPSLEKVNWKTRAAVGNYCKLDKGATYYVNVRFLSCTGQFCNTTLRAINLR